VSPGAAQVFVYYRVRAADAAVAIAAVRALHAGFRAELPGLVCTLSQRADNDAELLTLMETYRHANAVDDAWRRTIERAAGESLAAWIVGERHVEVFAPCA